MVQIPDNVRPSIDAIIKHHFWLLLAIVPLVVLPAMVFARGQLAAEIDSARGQVESRLAAVKGVSGIQPHPNESWSGEIDKATDRVKRETLAEWRRFWTSQQPLRQWPAALGPDFVQRVTALKPGGKLPRPLLERYQNGIRAIVRTLPARMGADEFMVEGENAAAMQPPGAMEPGMMRGRPGVPEKPVAMLQWNPADQQRLYASFNWQRPPSTTQVLLAQEELWVYGVLVDAIARANKASAGAYNAAIPMIEQLAVGYPAAEDHPGAANGGRIVVPAAAGAALGQGEFAPPPDMMASPEGGGPMRPAHPRFGGVSGPGGGMPATPDAPPPEATASPDDLLKSWIYVDFSGKPLTAAELAASTDAQLVHLVPFVIRAVVDERKLDALLVDLATSPVPIDVRQVRINAGPAAAMAGMPEMGPSGGFGGAPSEFGGQLPGGQAPAGGRPHDVTVELRGTVALAAQPDPQVLGLDAVADDEAAAGGAERPAAEPQPAAAGNAEGNQP